jgi:hypothetical protein
MTELHALRVSSANVRPSAKVTLAAPRGGRRALLRRGAAALAAVAVGLIGTAIPATADRITHPIAVFSGLDKITGRIISFEVAMNETVQFGSLQITERACYTRPATEAPQTTAFLEIDEIDAEKNYKRLFSGWMFAASPGLHGLEHPVYDVWLIDCKGGTTVIPTPADTAAIDPPPPENAKPAPVPPPKPAKPKRTPAADEAKTDAPTRDGPVEVGPPPGFNNSPDRRAPPTQRFYPTPN